MEIKSGTRFLEINTVSYPAANYTLHKRKKFVMIMPLYRSNYIKIYVNGTTLDGVPAADVSAIYEFCQANIF